MSVGKVVYVGKGGATGEFVSRAHIVNFAQMVPRFQDQCRGSMESFNLSAMN